MIVLTALGFVSLVLAVAYHINLLYCWTQHGVLPHVFWRRMHVLKARYKYTLELETLKIKQNYLEEQICALQEENRKLEEQIFALREENRKAEGLILRLTGEK